MILSLIFQAAQTIKSPEGIQIPVGWVAVAGGVLVSAIVALFKWALTLLYKNEALNRELLSEKEQKVNILVELKRKAEEKKRREGTDRLGDHP